MRLNTYYLLMANFEGRKCVLKSQVHFVDRDTKVLQFAFRLQCAVLLLSLFVSCSAMCRLFSLAGNGLALGEGGDFHHKC